jgi:cystathionine beta-synthase
VVAVDPVGSILAIPDSLNDQKRLQSYQVEGIGYDFFPSVLDHGVVDEWVKVDDAEALAMARRMIRLEGLLVGGSSGSCAAGALKYIEAHRAELEGKRVVVLCPDSIRNYMSKFLDDAWMASHGFPLPDVNGESGHGESVALLKKLRALRIEELDQAERDGKVDTREYSAQKKAILEMYGEPQ